MSIELAIGKSPSPSSLEENGRIVVEINRRRADLDAFEKVLPWATPFVKAALSNNPASRPSLAELRFKTLTSAAVFIEAVRMKKCGDDANGVAGRVERYMLEEPALKSPIVRTLPRVTWGEMHHGVNSANEPWHSLNGDDVDVEMLEIMNPTIVAYATERYQLLDHRWQSVLGLCMDPPALIRSKFVGGKFSASRGALEALVEVGLALNASHLAGHAHGQVNEDRVVLTTGGARLVGWVLQSSLNTTSKASDTYNVTKLARTIKVIDEVWFSAIEVLWHENELRATLTEILTYIAAWDTIASTRRSMTVSILTPVEPVVEETVVSPELAAIREKTSSLNRQLATVVLPSLMDSRPCWAAQEADTRLAAADVLMYLLSTRDVVASEAIAAHLKPLLRAIVLACFEDIGRDLVTAAVAYARYRADVATTNHVVEAMVEATDTCLSEKLPNEANYYAGKLKDFSNGSTLSPSHAQRITAAVYRASCASRQEGESSRFKAPPATAYGKLPTTTRPFADVRRDMMYASYTAVQGERDDFSWLNIHRLELEYLLQVSPTMTALISRIHAARQIKDRALTLIADASMLAVVSSRGGCLAAGAKFAHMAVTVGANHVSPAEQLNMVEMYTQSLVEVAGGPAMICLLPSASMTGRAALAAARQRVIDGVADILNHPVSAKETPGLAMQEQYSTAVTDAITAMIKACQDQLPPAPCELAFLGLGSMANRAMSLYSDLEFAVVMSQPFSDKADVNKKTVGQPLCATPRGYVTLLVQLFELKVIALGESPSIEGLHVQGLCFDSGGNTPLIKPLAGTSDEIVSALADPIGGDLIMMGVLSSPCLIASSEQLFTDFRAIYDRTLRGQEPGSLRIQQGMRLLGESLNFSLTPRFRADAPFNAKTALYRLPSMALSALSVLFEATRPAAPLPLRQLITVLCESPLNVLDRRIGDAFVCALDVAARLRLAAHAHYGRESDDVGSWPDGKETLERRDAFAVRKTARLVVTQIANGTLLPLGHCLRDYFARLKDITERRARGAVLSLEPCHDVTRFFDALIREKVATISRPDVFHSLIRDIAERVAKTPTVVVPAAFQKWMSNDPDPVALATRAKLAFPRAIQKLEEALVAPRAALESAAGREQAELYTELTCLLDECGKQYRMVDTAYNAATADKRESMTTPCVGFIGCLTDLNLLLPTVSANIFASNGTFLNTVEAGRHAVNHLAPGLHFKENPSFPAVEYAVSLLGFLLDKSGIGRLSPPMDIIRTAGPKSKSHNLLLSQTIPGVSLHTALHRDPNILDKWRLPHFSLAFVLALLVCPEDGKPDNFIVVDNLTQAGEVASIDVVSVDNDHSFVTPFTTTGVIRKSERLFVKSIIFCCNQMMERVEEKVYQALAAISPVQLLRYWLMALCRYNESIKRIYTFKERVAAFHNGDGSILTFMMSTPVIKEFYERLCRMVELCAAPDRPTHIELLRAVAGDKLCDMYARALNVQDHTPLARFKSLTANSYSKSSKGTGQTLTSRPLMLSSNLELPNVRSVQLDDPQFDVAHALESLHLIDSVKEQELLLNAVAGLERSEVAGFSKLAVAPLQEKALRRVRWTLTWALSPNVRDVLMEIFSVRLRHLTLQHCPLESFSYDLRNLASMEILVSLDVSYSAMVNWNTLREKCRSLQVLVLRGCPLEPTLELSRKTQLPCLKSLDLRETAVVSLDLPHRFVKLEYTDAGNNGLRTYLFDERGRKVLYEPLAAAVSDIDAHLDNAENFEAMIETIVIAMESHEPYLALAAAQRISYINPLFSRYPRSGHAVLFAIARQHVRWEHPFGFVENREPLWVEHHREWAFHWHRATVSLLASVRIHDTNINLMDWQDDFIDEMHRVNGAYKEYCVFSSLSIIFSAILHWDVKTEPLHGYLRDFFRYGEHRLTGEYLGLDRGDWAADRTEADFTPGSLGRSFKHLFAAENLHNFASLRRLKSQTGAA